MQKTLGGKLTHHKSSVRPWVDPIRRRDMMNKVIPMESSSEGEDRISNLPAELRHLILSLLPYHEAVATSILSTTWRYDWLHSYSLNIDHNFFQFWKSYDKRWFSDSFYHLKYESVRYFSFLYNALIRTRMMMCYDDNRLNMIPKLELDLSNLYLDNPFDPIVIVSSFLERLNYQSLVLSINEKHICDEFMQFLSSTKSLTELRVGSSPYPGHHTRRTITGLVNPSPCLRKVYIDSVSIFDHSRLEKLLVNNTFVESLTIDECYGLKHLKLIGLSKLKELHLSDRRVKRVEINGAPNFHSLYYVGSGLNSRVLFTNGTLTQHTLSCEENCVSFQVSHLKEMKLKNFDEVFLQNKSCMSGLQKLSCFGQWLSQMDIHGLEYCENLTHLELVHCKIVDSLLNQALSKLAKLEVLIIQRCDQLTHVKVSLKHLGTVSFINCTNLELVEMDCPNISNFKCKNNYYNQHICVLRGSISTPTCVDVHVKEIMWGFQYQQLLESLEKLRNLQYQQLFQKIEDLAISPVGKEEKRQCLPLFEVEPLKVTADNCIFTIPPVVKEEGRQCLQLFEVKHLKITADDCITEKPTLELLDKILWLCPHIKRIQFTSRYHKEFGPILKLKPIRYRGSDICQMIETLPCNPFNIIIRFDYKEPISLGDKCGCYTNAKLPVSRWMHSIRSIVIEEIQGLEDDDSMGESWNSVVSRWNERLSKMNSHCEKSEAMVSTKQELVAASSNADNNGCMVIILGITSFFFVILIIVLFYSFF